VSELSVLPLGGCGEVGLNATLLLDGADGLLIDCGVLLNLQDAPGVERAVPDFGPLFRAGRQLRALVLTHGHEDHLGAVGAFLAETDAPVYGPPLAIALLSAKLEGLSAAKRERLHAVPLGETVEVPPFRVEWIRMTHSLPDSAALHIETRAGRVLHSGDFKLDPRPLDGRLSDVERLRALGELGVELLLADSTNSELPGSTGAEAEVGLEIERLVREAPERVVVACFASHLHRIEGVVRAARSGGRRIALVGRALQTAWRLGIEGGHLSGEPGLLLDERRLERVPRKEQLLLVTGSQGEPRAGLSRVATGGEAALRLGPGDRVILSASTIPGNERAVRRLKNAMRRTGAEVVDDRMAAVHCSGHAHQDEQAELLRLVRPRFFVPVHGDRAMLERHAQTAVAAGIVPRERVLVIEDGDSAVLSAGELRRGPTEPVRPRPVDADSGEIIGWEELEDRRRIGASGLLVCVAGLGFPPAIAAHGFRAPKALEVALAEEVSGLLPLLSELAPPDRVEMVRLALRRRVTERTGAHPVIDVRLV
jgi:ribonuclease J